MKKSFKVKTSTTQLKKLQLNEIQSHEPVNMLCVSNLTNCIHIMNIKKTNRFLHSFYISKLRTNQTKVKLLMLMVPDFTFAIGIFSTYLTSK